jgi:hypothetical protein
LILSGATLRPSWGPSDRPQLESACGYGWPTRDAGHSPVRLFLCCPAAGACFRLASVPDRMARTWALAGVGMRQLGTGHRRRLRCR